MATRIEPCPFCGAEHNHISHNMLAFYVVCQHCNSSGPRRRKVDTAIRDWNALSINIRQSRDIEEKSARIEALLSHLHQLEHEVKSVLLRAKC